MEIHWKKRFSTRYLAGILAMVLAVLATEGCRGGSTDSKQSGSPAGAVPVTGAQPVDGKARLAASTLTPANEALVQVFFFGLAMVESVPKNADELEKISVHLPFEADHNKRLLVGLDRGGVLRWESAYTNSNGTIVKMPKIDSSTITLLDLDSPPPTIRESSPVIGIYPADKVAATDARWLLHANEFAGVSGFDRARADSHLELESGVLETCGLVHSATLDDACRVMTGPGGVARSAAEYMVMRFRVPLTKSSITVRVESGGNREEVKIPRRGGSIPVEFENESFDKIFDILVINAPDESVREMRSHHLGEARGFFRTVSSVSPWGLSSPDCIDHDAQNCPACQFDLQPKCFEYLKRYFGQLSGANRPLCPIMGYP